MTTREKCTAKSKQSGQRCKNYPSKGAKTCRFHGSGNARSKAAAARRVAEAKAKEQAESAVVTLGLPVDISPTEALLDEVKWTAGHVRWLRGKVQELETHVTHIVPEGDEDDDKYLSESPNHAKHGLTWGTSKIVDKRSGEAPGVDTTESAAPSVWYVLYERERAHLVAVCAAALRAGVEERRVRLAEKDGDLVAVVMRRVLDRMLEAMITAGMAATLGEVWQASVMQIVPHELRRLAGSTDL